MASFRRVALTVGTAVVVVAGAGAALVAQRSDPASRPRATPSASASATLRPSLAPLVTRTVPPLAAELRAGPAASGSGVTAALASRLAAAALGARVNAMVADATTGTTLYDRDAGRSAIPASTTKVFTAAAALHALGPDHRFETKVVAYGTVTGGVLTGDLVVVGGGDPTLTNAAAPAAYPRPATLGDLARRVRKAGVTRVTGDVVVDSSIFDGPGLAPGWKPTYVTEGSVAPIRGFMVDGGRVALDDDDRTAQPDLTGGLKLRNALRAAGVRVGDTVRRGSAPASATDLARVSSPTVAALVERMLVRSDNELAEALARHVAIARGASADFAGVAAALPATVRDLGVDPPLLHDGSGLSRLNRVTPRQLVEVLVAATKDPALAPVVTGLPVGAFTGTLASRYDEAPSRSAAGRVRAKTGSLDNVATLAGVVETASGRVLVFAFTADRLPTRFVGAAARALDAAVAALAACGCA